MSNQAIEHATFETTISPDTLAELKRLIDEECHNDMDDLVRTLIQDHKEVMDFCYQGLEADGTPKALLKAIKENRALLNDVVTEQRKESKLFPIQ